MVYRQSKQHTYGSHTTASTPTTIMYSGEGNVVFIVTYGLENTMDTHSNDTLSCHGVWARHSLNTRFTLDTYTLSRSYGV